MLVLVEHWQEDNCHFWAEVEVDSCLMKALDLAGGQEEQW